MSTAGIENLLSQAMKNLSAEWQNTCEHWRDSKAMEFEKTYLEPLPHHVVRACTAITELNAQLRKIRGDCE